MTTEHKKQIEELIAAGEKATHGKWFNHGGRYPNGVKGDVHIKHDGKSSLSTTRLLRVLDDRVFETNTSEKYLCSLDALASKNAAYKDIESDAKFIAQAANAREALQGLVDENERLNYRESQYDYVIEDQKKQLEAQAKALEKAKDALKGIRTLWDVDCHDLPEQDAIGWIGEDEMEVTFKDVRLAKQTLTEIEELLK